MPTLVDPIKCRWCPFVIRRFERRDGGRLESAWDMLRDHVYDAHPEQSTRYEALPRQTMADTFEWSC